MKITTLFLAISVFLCTSAFAGAPPSDTGSPPTVHPSPLVTTPATSAIDEKPAGAPIHPPTSAPSPVQPPPLPPPPPVVLQPLPPPPAAPAAIQPPPLPPPPAIHKSSHPILLGGMGMLMLGDATMTKLDNLNADLTANGYPALDKNYASLGGAGLAIIKRFVIGGEGHAFSGRETVTSGGTVFSSSAAYGLFDIGYLLISSRSFLLYPLFGIGMGGFTLRFSDESTASFTDLLAYPKRESTLSSTSAIVGLGIGADFIVNLGREDSPTVGGLLVGVQLGLLQAAPNSTWNRSMMSDTQAVGGPDTGITGPYLRISIGGIGMRMPQ